MNPGDLVRVAPTLEPCPVYLGQTGTVVSLTEDAVYGDCAWVSIPDVDGDVYYNRAELEATP